MVINQTVLLYSLPFGITGLSALIIAVNFIKRHQSFEGGKWLIVLLFSSAIWSIGQTLEYLSTDIGTKIIWDNLQWFGIAYVSPAFYMYSLGLNGKKSREKNLVILLMFIFPAIILLLVYSNPLHNLFSDNYRLLQHAGFTGMDKDYTILFWIVMGYTYAIFTLGVVNLIQINKRQKHHYKNQVNWTILAGLFVVFVSILDIGDFNPYPFFQPTALAMSSFTIVVAGNMRNFQKLDKQNITRNILLESIPNPLLIISDTFFIEDLNSSALNLIGETRNELVGKHFEIIAPELLGQLPTLVDWKTIKNDSLTEVHYKSKKFNVEISPKRDNAGRLQSYILQILTGNNVERGYPKLQHSNALIKALGKVAAEVAAVATPEQVFERLKTEFKTFSLDFIYVSFDNITDTSVIEFASFNPAILKPLEKIAGVSFLGFRIPHSNNPPIIFDLENGEPVFMDDFIKTIRPAYQQIPKELFNTGLEILGISTRTNGILIPLSFSNGASGFLAIWGNSLQEEDLHAFSIFGSQLESTIEQSHLIAAEKKRIQDLTRSNLLVHALNKVGTEVTSSFDPSTMLEILDTEISELGLSFYICLVDHSDQTAKIHYVSIGSKVRKSIEKTFGVTLLGYKIPHGHWPNMAIRALEEQQAIFVQDFSQDIEKMFQDFPDVLAKRGLNFAGITKETAGIHITKDLQDGSTMVFTIWGENIQENDLATFSGFANQIANSFELGTLFKTKQTQTIELKKSKLVVDALSRVATNVATSTNPDEILKTLGDELNHIDLDCLLVLVDRGTDEAFIRYHTMQNELLVQAEKLTRRKLSDQRLALDLWPPIFKNVFESKQPVFIEKFRDLIATFIGIDIPKIISNRAIGALDINEQTRSVFLPLESSDVVFGCLAIWANSIDQDDLPAFTIFASQVAIAFKNAELLLSEKRQAQNLAHNNSLITALNKIASFVTTATTQSELMEVMNRELAEQNIDFVNVSLNKEDIQAKLDYASLENRIIDRIQKDTRLTLNGMTIPRKLWSKEAVRSLRKNQPRFLDDFQGYIHSLFPHLGEKSAKSTFQSSGIDQNTSGIFLPIRSGDGSTQLMMLWGNSLQESDLAAFKVYKLQMESILETSRLYRLAEMEIDERHNVEKALSISQKEFRGLFENAHDAIIISDPNTYQVLNANERAAEIFGYTQTEFTNKKITDFSGDGDKWQAMVSEIINKIVNLNFEITQFCTHGQEPLAMEVNAGIVTFEGIDAIQSIHRDVTDRKKLEAQLTHDSLHDPLTKLPNRNLFLDRLDYVIKRSVRSKDYSFAVLFIDLDRFKNINDSMGHLSGDNILVEVANRLETCLRAEDSIGRIGGDEFVILLEGVNSTLDTSRMCERILDHIEQPYYFHDLEIQLSGSIGVVMGSSEYENPEEYLRDADIAMYRAKQQGKARFDFFDIAMREQVLKRIQLEKELRKAVVNKDFSLVYQPIVNILDRELIGFEALIRWHQPGFDTISPSDFIPAAEDFGLIHSIGNWVLEEACYQMQEWITKYPQLDNLILHVNVSPLQLLRLDFPDDVRTVLEETGLNPKNIALEITETAFINNQVIASRQIKELNSLGVQIHLDDFGTGYSSLSFINLFQIDALKIEKQFIAGLEKQKQTDLIFAILALGDKLNLKVIAEGIETKAQHDHLKEIGCLLGQGYYYSKPICLEEVDTLLESRTYQELAIQ